MRTILAACLALGAACFPLASASQAQLTVRVPGIAIETGPSWRQHHDGEWRDRGEFRETEHRRVEWQRDHCVRDWSGHAFCR